MAGPLPSQTVVRPPCTTSTLLSSLLVATACGTTDLAATRLDPSNPSLGGAPASPTEPAPQDDEPASEADPEQDPKNDPPTTVEQPSRAPSPTLRVDAGALTDHCGSPLLLRGVNEMSVWSVPGETPTYVPEIAQTGANALRIVWLHDADPGALGEVLEEAFFHHMVAVVEFHDRENLSEPEALDRMVSGWTSPAMVEVLTRYQRNLIVELGSGVPSSPADEWTAIFTDALGDLRAADLKMPIGVRLPDSSLDGDVAIRAVQDVIESDPLKNSLAATLFWEGRESDLRRVHLELHERSVASYIAEFAGYHSGECPRAATDYPYILDFAQREGIGWFAWSWGGVPNATCAASSLDMSSDGTLQGLEGWGRQVALADPNGISRTASPLATWEQSECAE